MPVMTMMMLCQSAGGAVPYLPEVRPLGKNRRSGLSDAVHSLIVHSLIASRQCFTSSSNERDLELRLVGCKRQMLV